GEVVPVGSEQATRVDLRVVSASHKDLQRAVIEGRFRQDLYYRLVGAEIAIPPLRDRGDDVLELAETFLARIRQKRVAPTRFSADAVTAMRGYRWPGNVRELRHAVERAAAIAALAAAERRFAEEAMAKAGGNVSEAARLLGITRIMLKRRLDRFANDDGD